MSRVGLKDQLDIGISNVVKLIFENNSFLISPMEHYKTEPETYLLTSVTINCG